MDTSWTKDRMRVVDARKFLSHPTVSGGAALSRVVREAALDTGFFYLKHNIPSQVTEATLNQLQNFFALPLEAKMKIHVSKQSGFRGYSAMYEQGNYGIDVADARAEQTADGSTATPPGMDHKEVFHMGRELPTTHPHYSPKLFAPNAFPPTSLLPEFRTALERYYNHTYTISNQLFGLFAESLNLQPNFFDKLTHEGMDSMNCIHYPPLTDPTPTNSQLGIGEHTDYECFTLLWQQPDGPTSLEILRDGGHWEPVPPMEGTFVVNIGDMMARWTNGEYQSTVHRTRVHSERHRYSIAFFRACNYDTTLSNLIEGQAAKYPPITAGEHMLGRIDEANEAFSDQWSKAT